jgi:hypothetical protein
VLKPLRGVDGSGTRRARRGGDKELVLSPRLYLSADDDNLWPDPDAARLVARVNRRRYVTSEAVLGAATGLGGDSEAVSLIPAAAVFDEASSEASSQSARGFNGSHRRHRFRSPPNRARCVRFAVVAILCMASVGGFLATHRSARTTRAELVVSASALASAEDLLAVVSDLEREAGALQETIAGLDQFALVPPASLVGAIVAALPATVTVGRLSIGRESFVVDARGDNLLGAVGALEALTMVADVTVQSRSEADGSVSGQIRGRLGP